MPHKIPIKNSLITAHVNPDGDALSCIKAVSEYLTDHSKLTAIRVNGTIPNYLQWIVSNETTTTDIPPWVEQVIVLDSEPTPKRLGWEIPANLPIVNIDHHIHRIEHHNPDNNVFVFDSCSVAAALILNFNIVNPILIVGLYTDTLFSRKWSELLKCFNKLQVSDEDEQFYINSIRPKNDKRTTEAVRKSKVKYYANGFAYVTVKETDYGVLEEVMRFFHRFNESVCLVSGDGVVKLRTDGKSMNVAKIAEELSGGGHHFAAQCSIASDDDEKKLVSLVRAAKPLEE